MDFDQWSGCSVTRRDSVAFRCIKLGQREQFYQAEEGRILGSEEFVEKTKKRVGETRRVAREPVTNRSAPDIEVLIAAVAQATRLTPEEICSRRKTKANVLAKEAMIVVAHETGASNKAITRLIGLDTSVVSRRLESGSTRMRDSFELQQLVKEIRRLVFKVEIEDK